MQVILKVLYISYDGMTDPLGQSQVIPYLRGLSIQGHTIFLISCEKPERYSESGDFIRNLLQEAGIQWEPLPYSAKPPVISTIRDLRRIKKTAAKIIEKEQIEAVHCRSYISALAGLAMKKRFGTRFIFDMRGFWADERVDGGLWSLKNPLYRLVYSYFKKREKDFLQNADQIISLTENARREIHSWPGMQHVPITVIPCCADLGLFQANENTREQSRQLRAELGIPDDAFVISYLGSLGTWYMLPEMLEFFEVLLEKKPDSYFLILTGDSPSIVDEALSESGGRIPKERIIIRKAKRGEVPAYSLIGNVSLFFIKPLFSKKASSPTKMGELMALGIPLIVNSDIGDVEEILSDGGNGHIVRAFNRAEYEKAVARIDELQKLPPGNNIQCARKYYSLEKGISKYQAVYHTLRNDGKGDYSK